MHALFPLGRLCATPEVLEALGPALVAEVLARHARGDWGELLCAADRRENERALKTGARLFSAYETPAGRCWVSSPYMTRLLYYAQDRGWTPDRTGRTVWRDDGWT